MVKELLRIRKDLCLVETRVCADGSQRLVLQLLGIGRTRGNYLDGGSSILVVAPHLHTNNSSAKY
jgi:hypothetical protein